MNLVNHYSECEGDFTLLPILLIISYVTNYKKMIIKKKMYSIKREKIFALNSMMRKSPGVNYCLDLNRKPRFLEAELTLLSE